MSRHFRWISVLLAVAAALGIFATTTRAQATNHINHIVVIYLENHSFDNLYGQFAGANGLVKATDTVTQVDKDGKPYATLPKPINTNLKPAGPDTRFTADLPNKPFGIDQYVPLDQQAGDLVHRFYQEQMQIDDGKMDKFAAVSDAAGLSMGYYDPSKLPLATWAKKYTLADNFFHAAFGGSFLNHFWLVCACSPVWKDSPPADRVAQLDDKGAVVKDGSITPDGYIVNTSYAWYSPHPVNVDAGHLVPPQTMPTIGDRLSDKKIDWAWYSGGWADALAGHPDPLFQFHHQVFAFFKNYGDGTDGRKAHLKDEKDFMTALKDGSIPAVSFVKPLGEENEHPGYATTAEGEKHVADMLTAIQNSPAWKDTVVIITYDENGGFWDHVAPPKIDKWGPCLRVPTLIISPYAKKGFVDSDQMDTTSILAFIENRYGLDPLSDRDKAANNMLSAFDFSQKPDVATPAAATAAATP